MPPNKNRRYPSDARAEEGVMSEFRAENLSKPGAGEHTASASREPTRTGPLSEAKLLGRRTPPVAAEAAVRAAQPGGYQSLTGLLFGYALLIAGNGLFQTLIPLTMLGAGTSTLVVGLVQSCYYGGFLAGAVCNRRLIDRIGQHRTFVAFAAAAAILASAFSLIQSPWAWASIRFLTGLAFMGLYTSIESWLNGISRNENRGQVFGTYAAINYLAIGTGQFMLRLGDGADSRLFSLVAALFAAAVIPVSLFEGWPVRVADESLERLPPHSWRNSLRSMAQASPLAIPGCILAGFLYSTFYSMTPVFLQRTGFSTSELSTFMGVALIGALIPQWPMGRLSDRIDRRRLVYATAMVSMSLSLMLAVLHFAAFVWAGMLAYVAVTFTQYGLIVSHIHDRTQPHLRVSVSVTLLLLFSVGGLSGPAIASLLMTAIGPTGLFVFNALASLLMALSARRALRAIR
jgi:MFS family permease